MPLLPSPEWISEQARQTSATQTIPSLCTRSLREFIPAISPRFVYPDWLEPIFTGLAKVELALRGEGPAVKLAFSVPPQFGKSTALHHWLARTIGRYQHLQSAYCSYAADLARTQSRKIRTIARAAHVPIDPAANRLEEWLTPSGGGLVATGVGGPLTGKPISGVGAIDDPVKNREEAESARQRETTWDWYTDTFLSRLHPQASQVIVMTRWHVDDLIGRVTKEDDGWEIIALPAILPNGESLWPDGRPLDFLEARRKAVGEYGWYSMYMQEPRPRGGALFNHPPTCQLADVPTTGRQGSGVDLAYTAKTHSDYSVIVTLIQAGDRYFVRNVRRYQAGINEADGILAAHSATYPGPMVWHSSGMESAAVGSRLQRLGIPLTCRNATTDKFVRAQPVSAAWNDGKIIVPRDASWSADFLDELTSFTGVGDKHDDQVDALASAFSALDAAPIKLTVTGAGQTYRQPRASWRNAF